MTQQSSQRGFSLLEILIVMGIVSIIIGGIAGSFRSHLTTWSFGTGQLEAMRNGAGIPALIHYLQSAKKITAISLNQSTDGYVEFEMTNGTKVQIYRNSDANKSIFSANSLPSHNLVIVFPGSPSPSVEVLAQHISEFSLTSYSEDPGYFRVASPNNTANPVTFSAISSIRYRMGIIKNNHSVYFRGLVHVGRSPIADAVTTNYTAYGDFVSHNMVVLSEGGAHLKTISKPVKIRFTGQYFDTITDAMTAAVSGNEICVVQGNYSEGTITVKAGVRLYGGFNSATWQRNPSTYTTTIQGLIKLNTNTVLDGLTISHTISPTLVQTETNATGILVSNCTLTNPSYTNSLRGISIQSGSNAVTLLNTTIDADIPIYIRSASNVNVYRCRLKGNSYCADVQDSTNCLFQNTLFVDLSNSSRFQNASLTFRQNVFDTQAKIRLQGTSSGTIKNNIIYKNQGLENSGSGLFTVEYNAFVGSGNPGGTGNISIANENDVFVNTTDYVLQDTSTAVDAGDPSISDNYLSGLPGKGGSRSDMGLYGGPTAGRAGPGTVWSITTSDTPSTILSNAFPGDTLSFSTGNFSLSSPFSLKSFSRVWGVDAKDTFLSLSGTGKIEVGEFGTVESMSISRSSGSSQAVSLIGNATAKGLYIESFPTGITVTADATLLNNTLRSNTTGIQVNASGKSVTIRNHIIDSSSVGIDVVAGTVSAVSTNFFNTTTQTSGPLTQTDTITTDPQFWNTSQSLYDVRPTSNARNLGCFESVTNTGYLISPTLNTSTPTAYRSISVSLFGASNQPSKAAVSTLQMVYILDSQAVTLSPTIEINSTASSNYTWNLGPGAIGKSFRVKPVFTSYRWDSAPYLNTITIK